MLEYEGKRLCTACGASNAAQASFCRVCGAVLLGEVRLEDPPLFSEAASLNQQPELLPESFPVEAAPPPEESELPAATPAEAVEQKRCGWCSAMNPWTADVCESCGARFPSPEQDAAFLRASQERMQAEEARVDYLRARRLRKNSWGFRWRFRL
jgi:ribosomal protein L40E